MPYKTATGATYDSGDYAATMDKALDLAGYDELRQRQEAARVGGELFGIGVATFANRAARCTRTGIDPD